VLGGLSEFERHLIIARTGEDRKRAKAHGVLFGRPRKLTPHQRREVIAHRDAGKETLMDIARSYNVGVQNVGVGDSPAGRGPIKEP
jgi:DNA invertase Pin-like site-specific DNA recombinase